MKIIHTADWHLCDRLGRIDRTADLKARVERVAELCEQHAADVLLVAGDLFSEQASLDQMTDADLLAFARLLDPDSESLPAATARDRLANAVRSARARERLVSCADYEAAAVSVDAARIARAHCLPNRDLTGETAAGRRGAGSVGAALTAAMQGAQIIRVHDVRLTRHALNVWAGSFGMPF